MKKFKSNLSISLVLFIALIFESCSASLINLSESKILVKNYYEGGQYNKDLNKIIADAIDEFRSVDVTKNTIVIFDVDDTALSNYDFIKSMDFGYVDSLWLSYLDKGNAPVIYEVKTLYDYLINRRVKIIFLTGRSYINYESTYKNLKDAGYTEFDTLIVRSENQMNERASDYKSIERLTLSNLGYIIIGCVGDQDSDFNGGNTGIKVKLPNYMYKVN
jgi:predicted secreted acid phosphatase